MKISPFALPLLVQSQDDTSTLLSLKVQTVLETGVDHLLDAVGSRNVTQMSSLLQNLVEDTISEGPYELDSDVTSALDVIKRELVVDIRSSLKESHCYDQSELHNQILCFAGCETRRNDGVKSCGELCDGWAHKQCREDLLGMYKVHITACRALDDFVWSFSKDCDFAPKKCCLLSHTTWNCGGLCSGTIAKLDVDGTFGVWLNGQIAKFEAAHKAWLSLHSQCKTAYEVYVEQDAKCDCEQARCETTNCEWDRCQFMVCEDAYQRCWASCDADKISTEKEKECLEKDRKIDWSATEKIECYVNVLLEKPTPEDLKKECGTADCYNVYREHMYKRCNEICVVVDFGEGHHTSGGTAKYQEHARRQHIEGDHTLKQTDSKDQDTHQGADQDVTGEGEASVRTTHRGAGEDGRCTSHLDLDYQVSPCCQPCMERPSRPCEPVDVDDTHTYASWWYDVPYMWHHYGQHGFLSNADIKGFDADVCWAGEHTQVYAYNLCPCLDCEPNSKPPPQPCDASRACAGGAYTDGAYDYSVHTVVVDCDAISKSDPTYGAKEAEVPLLGR